MMTATKLTQDPHSLHAKGDGSMEETSATRLASKFSTEFRRALVLDCPEWESEIVPALVEVLNVIGRGPEQAVLCMPLLKVLHEVIYVQGVMDGMARPNLDADVWDLESDG